MLKNLKNNVLCGSLCGNYIVCQVANKKEIHVETLEHWKWHVLPIPYVLQSGKLKGTRIDYHIITKDIGSRYKWQNVFQYHRTQVNNTAKLKWQKRRNNDWHKV